jgi:hypothetical protein
VRNLKTLHPTLDVLYAPLNPAGCALLKQPWADGLVSPADCLNACANASFLSVEFIEGGCTLANLRRVQPMLSDPMKAMFKPFMSPIRMAWDMGFAGVRLDVAEMGRRVGPQINVTRRTIRP